MTVSRPQLALLASIQFSALLVGACATSLPDSLDSRQTTLVAEEVARLTGDLEGPREKALAIFRFVRDGVDYGFTRKFDAADPSDTLHIGRGHCNPKTELFVSMLRSVGIEARQRFVTISGDVLYGLFPKRVQPPQTLDHSYAEVRLDGRWLRVDGFIPDSRLFEGARARLRSEGLELGYGVHLRGCNSWNGLEDCMAQFADAEMLVTEHPLFDPARAFYRSPSYTQRLGPVSGFFYRVFGVAALNKKLDEIRGEDLPDSTEARDAQPSP